MKLRQVRLENFRGIKGPFPVDVDDFTSIIGRNEVGKSTVLAAVAIFLEADGVKIDEGDGCVDGDPAKVRITCEFDELPSSIVLDDSFPTSLKNEQVLTTNSRLRIRKEFDCTKKTIKPNIFIECHSHPADADGNSLLVETLPNLKKKAKALGVELETGEAPVKAKIRHAIVSRSEAFSVGAVKFQLAKNESATLWDQIRKHLPLCALFNADRPSSDQDPEAQDPIKVAVDRALSGVNEKLEALALEVDKQVQGVAKNTLAELRQMDAELAEDLIATLREELKRRSSNVNHACSWISWRA